jgi:hypothetical protein
MHITGERLPSVSYEERGQHQDVCNANLILHLGSSPTGSLLALEDWTTPYPDDTLELCEPILKNYDIGCGVRLTRE